MPLNDNIAAQSEAISNKVNINAPNTSAMVAVNETSNALYFNAQKSNGNLRQFQLGDTEFTLQNRINNTWSRAWTLYPTESGNTVSSDLNTVTAGRLQIFIYNSTTLHSPYKEHSDWGAEGMVFSYASDANYATQFAIISGGNCASRKKANGTWQAWHTLTLDS